MSHRRVVAVWLLASALYAAGSGRLRIVHEQPATTDESTTWGEPSLSVRCSLHPARQDLADQSDLVFEFRTENGSASTRFIESHGDFLSINTIRLVGPDGKEPPLTKEGGSKVLGAYDRPGNRTPIDPGKQVGPYRLDLGKMYKFDRPGRYEIHFSRAIFLDEVGFDSKKTAISNTAVFRVLGLEPIEAPKP